jgi:RyR domain.
MKTPKAPDSQVGSAADAAESGAGVSDAAVGVGDVRHNGYVPSPLDTSNIELTEDIRTLTELLAKNTHEVWAKQRMADGWKYGPHRDDERKEHPGLVPYEDLSEGEKAYDRNTALETLRVILALGYRLNKDTP